MFLLPNTSYFSSLTLDKIHYMYITCTSSTTIILVFFTSHLFSISLLIPNPHQLAQHHAFASVPDIWLCQFAELHFICCRAALGAADPATSLGLRVPLVRAVQLFWRPGSGLPTELSSQLFCLTACTQWVLHNTAFTWAAQLRIHCTSQHLLVVKCTCITANLGIWKTTGVFSFMRWCKNFHHWSELTWS